MRAVVIAMLAGCSFNPTALPAGDDSDPMPGVDAMQSTDDAPIDDPVSQAAPFVLDGEHWLLPCITNSQPNSHACTCSSSALTHMVTLGGTAGERWHVTVHIRGVMEHMGYTGGTDAGTGWYVGGAKGDAGNNFYELTISNPTSHYFINSGTTNQNNSWVHDYQATFDIAAGATVRFDASGQDAIQWEGVDAADAPISIAGVTDPPQPYNGQWAQLDVVSAVAF